MGKQFTENPLAISPNKAADLLGIAPCVVRVMLQNGELPGFKIGKRWLISVRALEDWVTKKAGRVI